MAAVGMFDCNTRFFSGVRTLPKQYWGIWPKKKGLWLGAPKRALLRWVERVTLGLWHSGLSSATFRDTVVSSRLPREKGEAWGCLDTLGSGLGRKCDVGHRRKWESQTRVGKLFAGNLFVPSLVFLTGGSHSIFVETCHLLSLVSMSLRQFANQQRIYIVPEVNHMWTQHTEGILDTIGDSPLIAIVPGLALTPSWTASHLILTQETVHVTEVKNSYWLETEGLERCLQHIE
ncbi:unnamed protein product, partial [Coregonus sp. 'balchen']